jgi:hypothetical protein
MTWQIIFAFFVFVVSATAHAGGQPTSQIQLEATPETQTKKINITYTITSTSSATYTGDLSISQKEFLDFCQIAKIGNTGQCIVLRKSPNHWISTAATDAGPKVTKTTPDNFLSLFTMMLVQLHAPDELLEPKNIRTISIQRME